MSTFLTRLNAAIDQAEQRARDAANARERVSLTLPRTTGKSALMAFWNSDVPATVLRNIAEDRAVLQRHTQMGNGCCDRCRDWDGSYVGWPCEEWLGVANRYGITPEEATDA